CTLERKGEATVPLSEARRSEILRTIEELAGVALRTLGVAYRRVVTSEYSQDESAERDLVFAGLIGMIDPPREEAMEAVARAKGAGVRPIMITGDHPVTASVIARELGIVERGSAITGAELERLSTERLAAVVRDVSVYARVSPEHKLRIVRALQAQGAVVAMT